MDRDSVADRQGGLQTRVVGAPLEEISAGTEHWHDAGELWIVKTIRAGVAVKLDEHNKGQLLSRRSVRFLDDVDNRTHGSVHVAHIGPQVLREHHPSADDQGDLVVKAAGISRFNVGGARANVTSDGLDTGRLRRSM